MKILVIGSGGREHAIGTKISKSKLVSKIYFAPGNAGTGQIGENISINADDISKLKEFAITNDIDLTVVGPELPLTMGIVDSFQSSGLKIFGPSKQGAMLESSKSFAKAFMQKYDIPTAKYEKFEDSELAIDYLKKSKFPIVIKADGLASGKGVIICQNLDEGIQAVKEIMQDKIFGNQGNTIVIEEFLEGKEVSLLCFTDSKTIIPMESASDYKKAYDGDKGLNTGGMGSISPSPYYKENSCDFIANKTLAGIQAENFDIKGVVYIGLIMTKDGPKVLEYNMRFGDPETEALLIRLETDLVEIMKNTVEQKLDEIDIRWTKKSAITVIMASEGYPSSNVKKGNIIKIPKFDDETYVFHCGTKIQNENIISDGGRVLAVSALGKDLKTARQKCYEQIEKIDFPQSFYRKDIGLI